MYAWFAPQLLQHAVIYHLLDDVAARLGTLAPLVEKESVQGTATVLATFPISRRGREVGRIAGVKVTDGSLARSSHCFRVSFGSTALEAQRRFCTRKRGWLGASRDACRCAGGTMQNQASTYLGA